MNLPLIYIDTSVYLKIFLKKKGTDKVRKLAKENRLLVSAILTRECFSAFSRQSQGKEIDDRTFDRLANHVKKPAVS
ncbi:MAG: PIN domain-containing protein [Candidatus Brocadiaceae bacterium]|nr:PIN domain-containing protein [Candidatus Brocadiaceae bacterium]